MADSQRKTANLVDESTILNGYYTAASGFPYTADDKYRCFNLALAAGTYTLKATMTGNTIYLLRVSSTTLGGNAIYVRTQYTFTLTEADTIYVSFRNVDTTTDFTGLKVMLNLGSTALPFEPYGWVHSLRKLGTATDTLTTLPVDIYTDGQTIGANLFDKTDYVAGKYINNQGVEATSSSGISNHSDYISIVRNNSYTLSTNKPSYSGITYAVAWYDSSKNFIIRDYYAAADNAGRYSYTFTAPSNAVYAIFNFTLYPDYDNEQIMFNSGNSALPYQPYTPAIIKGNMTQSGTPTPTTPITPSECGDRTGNLFDVSTQTVGKFIRAGNTRPDRPLGNIEENSAYNLSAYIPVSPDITYTLRNLVDSQVSGAGMVFFDADNTPISGVPLLDQGLTYTFTPPTNCVSIRFSYANSQGTDIMLNTGSTSLPYEPYGYKLDIKSASTTTPVYLGEVETTRKIKKLVLTGEEGWQLHSSVANLFRFDINDYLFSESNITLCTHYKSIANTGATGVSNGETCFYYGSSTARIIYIRDNSYSTANDFKTYLAQQYTNGTPVCVWYVLAEPTTGVVNEPLRKIGDYADTVSGISIPTITGADSFDVLTTLKPSEVSLTYTGWRDASVKEKSKNLFDKDAAFIGYYISSSTGEMIENSPSVASDYIPIIQGAEYYWNDPTARGNAGAFYDSNKNYLSGWSTSTQRYVFTAPNGAAYVRLTAAANNINNLQLNTGSTALPYEPYWK